MGDRYYIPNLECTYCENPNNGVDDGMSPTGVYYAPTCGFETFKCEHCGKTNFITEDCKAIKIEDITFELVKNGFMFATTGLFNDEEIDNMCKRRLKELQKREQEGN